MTGTRYRTKYLVTTAAAISIKDKIILPSHSTCMLAMPANVLSER